MKNIYLQIEYLGTHYFGFQIQHRKITVQGTIEKALKKLFHRKLRLTFAGRTDRGVHAKAQVVNFTVDTQIPLLNIKRALNTFLPDDIQVKKIKLVPLDFHSRFRVKSKIYRYLILNRPEASVFTKDFYWHISETLDTPLMKKAAKLLTGKKDFSLFAKEAKTYKHCVRKITAIQINKRGAVITIDITADGFLRNMCRNIVAFLVKVGKGKLSLQQSHLIIKRKTPYHNEPAPAWGLYLWEVKY